MSYQKGFSLIEILIVIALLGIFASLTFVSGKKVLQSQDELAAISILKQSLKRASTAASARGEELSLSQSGQVISLKSKASNKLIDSFELPKQFSITWPNLTFLETGLIDPSTLPSQALELTTERDPYVLSLSLMGELKAEVKQP